MNCAKAEVSGGGEGSTEGAQQGEGKGACLKRGRVESGGVEVEGTLKVAEQGQGDAPQRARAVHWWLPMKIEGQPVAAILASGSRDSFMGSALVDKLGLSHSIEVGPGLPEYPDTTPSVFHVKSGPVIGYLPTVKVELSPEVKIDMGPILVVDDQYDALFFGYGLMYKYLATFGYDGVTVRLDGGRVKFPYLEFEDQVPPVARSRLITFDF